MKNVWEVLVLIGLLIVLALLVLPLLDRPMIRRYGPACSSNLAQIVKACVTYQEPNNDYFPAFMQGTELRNPSIPASGQGSDYTFQPMPSLASLYPAYVDDVKIFGCPSTADRPKIAYRYYNGARHVCFGFEPNPNDSAYITNNTDPAVFTGAEVSTDVKCSYFYDELTNPRKMKPDQAIACDADGQTWINAQGNPPSYPSKSWTRVPRKPNHATGQNVIYSDGHVMWRDTVYSSTSNSRRDSNDNIFCPNSTNGVQWDADSDAYLWDGVNARAVQEVK